MLESVRGRSLRRRGAEEDCGEERREDGGPGDLQITQPWTSENRRGAVHLFSHTSPTNTKPHEDPSA